MIQDLHSHTYYSFCGKDSPDTVIEAAVNGGIEFFGICDHNYGVGFGSIEKYVAPADVVPNRYDPEILHKYYDEISVLKEKYAGKRRILCGIEIATDAERETALKSINAMSLRIEKANNIETLINAKGFEKSLVVIGESDVSVIVKSEGLTTAQTLQIQDVVTSYTEIPLSNIKIVTIK